MNPKQLRARANSPWPTGAVVGRTAGNGRLCTIVAVADGRGGVYVDPDNHGLPVTEDHPGDRCSMDRGGRPILWGALFKGEDR